MVDVPPDDIDAVFKALADPTRRGLLDRLHTENGQTLGQLCADSGMSRQATTQHLAQLESANLISTVRHGREKLHYLNPIPIHELQARWIHKFEQPRLALLHNVKERLENAMSDKPSFVYVTYIRTTPEQLWNALTDPELTAQYWDHRNESDWQVGSTWEHVQLDDAKTVDIRGTIVESNPFRKLVQTWDAPNPAEAGPSRVTYDIVPVGDSVKLTVTHVDLTEADLKAVSGGWPAVLSNLKTFLETDKALANLW